MVSIHSGINLLVPVVGLVLNVSIQLLIVRAISRLGVLRSVFIGFGTGGIGVLSAELYISSIQSVPFSETAGMVTANLIIYCALGYCYFHFINLGITARRIRILREIYLADQGLTLSALLERYNASEMIDQRLKRLLGSGQVVYRDNKYHIGKPTMLLMSRAIVAMKLIMLGKKSEFD